MLVYVAVALAIAIVLRRGDGPAVVAGAFVGDHVVSAYGLATRLFPDRFDASTTRSTRTGSPSRSGTGTPSGSLTAIGDRARARRRRARATGVVCASRGGAVLPLLVVAALLHVLSGLLGCARASGSAATVVLDPRRLTLLWSLLVARPAVGRRRRRTPRVRTR